MPSRHPSRPSRRAAPLPRARQSRLADDDYDEEDGEEDYYDDEYEGEEED